MQKAKHGGGGGDEIKKQQINNNKLQYIYIDSYVK